MSVNSEPGVSDQLLQRRTPIWEKGSQVAKARTLWSQTVSGSRDGSSASDTWGARLSRGTAELDALLAEGKEEQALALVKRLAGRTDEAVDGSSQLLTANQRHRSSPPPLSPPPFSSHHQVPRRSYSIEELKLHYIDPARMLAPRDTTLAGVRQGGQLLLLAGLVATWWGEHLDQWQLLGLVIGLLFIGTVDQ
ncbi:unnamed protein product, partial [Closterium sp. NIES-53]